MWVVFSIGISRSSSNIVVLTAEQGHRKSFNGVLWAIANLGSVLWVACQLAFIAFRIITRQTHLR